MPHPIHLSVLSAACAFGIACIAPAHAAEETPAIRAELRFAATGILKDHHTLWLHAGPGREPLEVRLNVRTFSEPVRYDGAPAAKFYATPAAARSAAPEEKPLATATLKEGGMLLVMVPAADTYRAFPIDSAKFPYQSFRFANLSEGLVRVEIGRQAANLKPGASQTLAFPSGEPSLGVRIFSQVRGAEPRLIRQSKWSLFEDQRELVLFFIDPTTGLVQSRHFVDTKTPEPTGMQASATAPGA
ncbi:MAG: hypothetical protein KDN05_03890 [Verrucomicrobiae bacterium]|nr:hypothetical protein [Verrucomicrobiae bacterium]